MKSRCILSVILAVTQLNFMTGPVGAETFQVVHHEGADTLEKWAAAELSTFLGEIYPSDLFPVVTAIPENQHYILLTSNRDDAVTNAAITAEEINDPGEFVVKHVTSESQEVGIICGQNPRAVLDGVYTLLEEKLGSGFYLYRNASEAADQAAFDFSKWNLTARPLYQERVSYNWYNFISGVTTWNLDDYKHWIRQSARMRYTDVMIHTYGWGPFTQFSHNGLTKEVEYLQNTAYGIHWGNQHTEDIRKIIGGEVLADEGPIFGADVGKVGYGGVTEENRVPLAKAMLREAVDYAANTVGIDFNWSFDIDTIYANPQNIIESLPEPARFKVGEYWLAQPETDEGYQYFKSIIETTMQDYPAISKITVWWRNTATAQYGGLSTQMTPEDLPEAWRATYDNAPAEAQNPFGPAHLYHSKIVQAFRNALDELGHTDVELGYGSWWWHNRHENFLAANYFMPTELTCYPLDYSTAFGSDPVYREELKKVTDDRKLVIIEWSQHDDHAYLGRPYLPPENLADTMDSTGVSGFGVMHWMTRPLDIFFKNLQNQVWSHTKNEPIQRTCEKMALDFFGESQSGIMAEYLQSWMTTAPQFGRETGRSLTGKIVNHDARVEASRDRVAILERVDTDALSSRAYEAWNYFKGHEEWIQLFHLAQKDRDRNLQEETIRKYIEKCSWDGGMTRGEKGILVQHNLKMLRDKYTSWSTSSYANPFTATAMTSDPDGDFKSNLMEFAFGTDPTLPDSGALTTDGTRHGAPILQKASDDNGFELYYLRAKDHGTIGSLNYTACFSSDLETFYDSDTPATPVYESSVDSSYELVKIPFPLSLPNGQPAKFGYVRVEAVE